MDGASTTLEALAQSERANALFEDFRTSIVSDILDSATYARTTYNDLLRAKADLAQHTETNTDLRSNPTSHASTTHQRLTRSLATAEKAFSLACQRYAAASSFVFATTPADLTNKMNLLAPPGEWVHDTEDEREIGSEGGWHETHDGKKILLGQGASVAAFRHPDAQRMRVALQN